MIEQTPPATAPAEDHPRPANARPAGARLRIYLGYAPGVGKTFKMLELARELVFEQVDVVLGCIETHGRYDVASQVLGLEILPRRRVSYRGMRLEDFDLEAALARKPRVLVLDDLACINAPGGRHGRRWEDVRDLLDAGIDVHTTLNVQHVESLSDVVAQITGVRVRETVPDSILQRADEIELVDCPPEELLARFAEGKVVFPDQAAARTAAAFLQRGNLLALRELALRLVAEHAGEEVQEYLEFNATTARWPATERIIACVGSSPTSERILHAASRIAARQRAPWIAVHAEGRPTVRLTQREQNRLESHLALAESLGGEVVRLAGEPASNAILDYARQHSVTLLLVGKPTHSRLRDRLRGSLLDELIRGSGDMDVHVIPGDAGSATEPVSAGRMRDRREPHAVRARRWLAAGTAVAAATGVGASLRTQLALPDVVMLFFLVIAAAAALLGRGPGLLASALSVVAYGFYFLPAGSVLQLDDQSHLLTFAMMFVVGLTTSGLALRIRRQATEARTREQRTAALYALSRDLGLALDPEQIALAAARHAVEIFGGASAVLLPDPQGSLAPGARAGEDLPLDAPAASAARWAFEHARMAGLGTRILPDARFVCLPLRSGLGLESVAVLALAPAGGALLTLEHRQFLDAFGRQVALALERARLDDAAKAAALRAKTEEMRSSLLSAVSHDLRTPLGAITGAATTLREDISSLAPSQRSELLDTVCEEAERLDLLVRNLLDMTRLESGTLEVKREWVPLEEIVGAAINRLEAPLAGRPLRTELPSDLPLVSADPVLLGQLFINLLENAVKYTPDGSPLEIGAHSTGESIVIELADRGPGLPPGSEARLFEKFQRGHGVGVGGAGLGLAICRGIAEAHGGSITAENRLGGGAIFRIVLPRPGHEPSLPPGGDADADADGGSNWEDKPA